MSRRALLGFLLAVLWAPAPARAQGISVLFVQPTRSETSVSVSGGAAAGTARIEISIPAGFTLDLGRPPGTVLGRSTVDLASAAAPDGEGSTAEGDVVVADPARYAADARLRACAPGTHAAVWRLEPLDLPIFVDPASGLDAALGGYDLRLCLDLAPGLSFQDVELDFKRSLGVPATPGIYLWRAFVTPLTPTGVGDERATWEAHGLVPWPSVLTLRARRTAQKDRFVLHGRLLLAGRPRAHAAVRVIGLPTGLALPGTPALRPVRRSIETNRAGRYRTTVRVGQRIEFFALWLPFPRLGCSSPGTAPGGCVTETTSPAASRPAVVRPRR
ncbi:MAG: hypothetical protein E6G22_01330 [Actinobacteria bacterium]|nr:MAG: hypothetical protein E6G22_01330 [Actinomycetota bacterium]